MPQADPPPIKHGDRLEAWPTKHEYITQEFGARPKFYKKFGLPAHEGIDIRAPLNTPIFACYSGTVFHASNRMKSDRRRNSAYGWHVWIRRENGEMWCHAHLRKDIQVKVGQFVSAGTRIGYSGNTGNSQGAHLHLGVQIPNATVSGLTDYPYNFVDPTDRVLPFDPERPRIGGYLEYKGGPPAHPEAVDTSIFRDGIKWSQIDPNGQGIYCVMPRASSGFRPDPDFDHAMIELIAAKKAGQRLVIVPFHDIHPDVDAVRQAEVFNSQVAKFGEWRAWMFDVEELRQGGRVVRALPKKEHIAKFVSEVRNRIGHNRPSLYYSSKRFADRVSKKETFGSDLMLAAYGVRDPFLPQAYGNYGWKFHQYTQEGDLNGYARTVDRSTFNGTIDELFAWETHKDNDVPPKPVDPPVVVTQKVNLLPYWQGVVGLAHNNKSFSGNHEQNETVQTVMFGDNEWGIAKNGLVQRYFLREYQGRMFIWQGPDTSPGNNRFYVTFFDGIVGSPVCPVEMMVGEEWRNDKPHWVQFYNLFSGAPSSDNSGPFTNWMKLYSVHESMTFLNGVVINDVVKIGNNEIHYLGKGRTLVGWRRLHEDSNTPPESGVSEIHAPFSRKVDLIPLPHYVKPDAAKGY